MADEKSMMPELTLDPSRTDAVPQLTLDPAAPAAPAPEAAKPEATPVRMDENLLNDAEKQAVEAFSKKIDLTDSNLILQYGAAAQKNVASFSENALNSVRTKDLGEVGKSLSELVVELKGFGEEEEKKGLFGLFKKTGSKLEAMKAQYAKVESNVDKIARELEQHQVTLLKDVAMFDQMYELNLKYYKELTMYILAGKKKLEDMRAGELPALKAKAEQSGAQEDAQAYNDMVQMCERFEKKLHDLELTRMISVQMGPQTRLLQNNDTLMVEKIQSSLVNTIPLWKSQMVLALGLEHSRQATQAQHHLALPQGDGVHQGGLDLLQHQGVVVLEQTGLGAHLDGDHPGELQVVDLLLKPAAQVGEGVVGLGVLLAPRLGRLLL